MKRIDQNLLDFMTQIMFLFPWMAITRQRLEILGSGFYSDYWLEVGNHCLIRGEVELMIDNMLCRDYRPRTIKDNIDSTFRHPITL